FQNSQCLSVGFAVGNSFLLWNMLVADTSDDSLRPRSGVACLPATDFAGPSWRHVSRSGLCLYFRFGNSIWKGCDSHRADLLGFARLVSLCDYWRSLEHDRVY